MTTAATETSGDRRPGRPRDARVDASIHQATLDEVCERGFGGATIEGIAARAGVGKTTIYRRFPDRETLLWAVAQDAAGECAVPDTGALRTDLLGLWDEFVEVFVGTLPGQLFNDLMAEARRNPALGELITADNEVRRHPACAAVERAKARGEVRPDTDADRVVDCVAGPFFYRLSLGLGRLDHAYGEALIDQVLAGVLSVPGKRRTAR